MFATEVEAAILSRVIRPESGDMPPEAAREILRLVFSEADHVRMEELSRMASSGTLTPAEQEELDGFINVSHLIAFLQSKARLSLNNHRTTAA